MKQTLLSMRYQVLQNQNSLLNALGTEAADILKDEFVSDKRLEEKTIKQIKEEYNVDKIKDAFHNAVFCNSWDFFIACNLLLPDNDNSDFISFLCFFGNSVDFSRNTTELYNNLLIEAVSGQQNLSFEKISDFVADIRFSI